jgi:serine/threonine protein kinase
MEYCNGGSLQDLVERRGFITEVEAQYIVKQIICAFTYMMSPSLNVIHRDLKPANIMLNFPNYPEKKMPRKIHMSQLNDSHF